MGISSLEKTISPDNPLRFIDAFVDHVNLFKLGYAIQTLQKEGHPSYNGHLFLKGSAGCCQIHS
jgi:hypothetical protein